MKNEFRISFLKVLTLAFLLMIPIQVLAVSYSYSNYVAIPTLIATPQWCPSDAAITYQENQPTEYSITGETACGYPVNSFNSSSYAAIDSDSFGDTGASGGNGAGGGGFVCGACAALHNSSNGASVTVVIVDECPQGGNNANNCWVGSYHLDIADAAYSTLAGGGTFPSNSGTNTLSGSTVTWRFVMCPASLLNTDNSSGDIAYEWQNSSKSTYNPIMFLDQALPIKSVGYSTSSTGPFTSCPRDSGGSNKLPNFWAGNGNPTLPSSNPLYFQITSYETGVAPVTVSLNGSSYSPSEALPPGTTTSQFASCVTGPTYTFTITPTVGSPSPTPTQTRTATPTATISGCKLIIYNGDTASTNLATIKTWTASATDTETTTEDHSSPDSLEIAYNWAAGNYYAGTGLNWTNYNTTNPVPSPYHPVLDLTQYNYLDFWVIGTTGAPIANCIVSMVDTAKNISSAVSLTGTILPSGITTSWQEVLIPCSDFKAVSAFTNTSVMEMDVATGAGMSSGTQTIFIDDWGFYGPCATSTPTQTVTRTWTPTPLYTFTHTNTPTSTSTPTPLPGCAYYYYTGTSPHALANGVSLVSVGGTETVVENTTAGLNGYTNGLDLQMSMAVSGYYAELGYNWAGYNQAPVSPYQPLVNLNNFTYLVFSMENTTSAASPMTWTVDLADYGGGGASGVTQSNPVTFVLTGTGVQNFVLPVSDFTTGGASYGITNVGEIDFEWHGSSAAQSATVYIDGIAFYGTCPTSTPTATNSYTPTRTNTITPSLTYTTTATSTTTFSTTPSKTYTSTGTPSSSATSTPSNTTTVTPTVTATKTSTIANTATSTNTITFTPTVTSSITQTFTATGTKTSTPTSTAPNTSTFTPTPPSTLTITFTHTSTASSTATSTASATFTRTMSITPSITSTVTPTTTFTTTRTITDTPVFTVTGANTATITNTNTSTPTATNTATASTTRTITITPTSTATGPYTATITMTPTLMTTHTITATSTYTQTSGVFTNTVTTTPTFTTSRTGTITSTITSTAVSSYTVTSTATSTATGPNTYTTTPTRTLTATLTNSSTPSVTSSITLTPALSNTLTYTPTPTSTGTVTRTNTLTATFTNTNTTTNTPTGTNSSTRTATYTATLTNTSTSSSTPTISYTPTITSTPLTGSAPITVTNATNQPPNANWLSGSATVISDLSVVLTNGSLTNTVTVTALNVTDSGTGSAANATVSISEGTLSLGTAIFSSSTASLSSLTLTIPANSSVTLLVSYNLTAIATGTFSAYLSGVTGTDGVSSTIYNNSTAGALLTILVPTSTPTATSTSTDTFTLTATSTNTQTSTSTASSTHTATWTATPTNTFTSTSTNTATVTSTFTNTSTASFTPTFTNVYTKTSTGTPTQSFTPTSTWTNTFTGTATGTATSTGTSTLTNTPTWTSTATSTITHTMSPTFTWTATFTFTPTWTSTSTSTRTATPVPTSTTSPTPTSTVSPTPVMVPICMNPFPNPTTGQPVEFKITVPFNSTVKYTVYTLAFRKVAWSQPTPASGTVTLTWNLQDNYGARVADGLYYVRIDVSGPQNTTKIFKVLVLR